MGLDMRTKKTITKELAQRYQKARKKERKKILNEFVSLTGYNRSYASWLLRNCGRKLLMWRKGKKTIIFVGEILKVKRRRKRIYDEEVRKALARIWWILDYACGKRLVPFLPEIIKKLEECGEWKWSREVAEKLLRISSSTVDRVLRSYKKKMEIKCRSKTKPGTLLKLKIPIKTSSELEREKPGYLDIDLVGHDGGNLKGDFIHTLDAVDPPTQWSARVSVRNRAQVWAFEGLKKIEERLPFPLLGIHSDNDSAFINAHFSRYCEEKGIEFTRSRPGRRNDNCFVEQKNWSLVRKAVGYMRYDREEELKVLNELWEVEDVYTNFFQPVMRLSEKERIGSRMRRRHDKAKTPYQRILENEHVDEEVKERLREEYDKLNPVELKREVTRLQNKLFKMASSKLREREDFHIETYVMQ